MRIALWALAGVLLSLATPPPLEAQTQVINPGGVNLAVIDPVFWSSLHNPTLVLPPVDWPVEVLVDGVRWLQLASLDPQGAIRTQTTRELQLPQGSNSLPPAIVFVQHPWDPTLTQKAPVYLTDGATADAMVYWRNFFGPNMVFAFAIFSLLAGLMTLWYWLTTKGARDNGFFYYSLFALGFVLSFIHYLLGFDSAPSLVLEKIRVIATPLWFLAFALYLLHRLGKARAWRITLSVMALAFVPLDVQVLLLPRVSDVLFASGPVYGLLLAQTLIVLGGLVYYALRRRDTKASTVVVFQLLAQASFAFDIGYYLVVGYHPPFLTSPYITMFLLVHLLYLMGSDLRRSQRAANEKSAALEHLNQGLHEEVDRRNLDLNSFVSIVSHDLKNMLFGLRQMTERLAGQTCPDPAALEQLAASTHRTEDVLASLLRLSSSRLATLKPQRRAVLVAALWSSALQDVSVQLLEGSVTIAHLGDEAATVFTDDTMVTTILRNLLFNAIKASPEGGEVRCETRFENDSTVLSVEDDGPGVPSDRSLHLFSFSERGFGLALSSELADRLGHRLELAPNQNRGAKFRLLLGQSGRAE